VIKKVTFILLVHLTSLFTLDTPLAAWMNPVSESPGLLAYGLLILKRLCPRVPLPIMPLLGEDSNEEMLKEPPREFTSPGNMSIPKPKW
jgi:hypothetical protein